MPTHHQHEKPGTYRPKQHLAAQQPILLPVARAATKKAKIADRIIDSRLNDADLYVARLAWKRPQLANFRPRNELQRQDVELSVSSLSSNLSDRSMSDDRPLAMGSLYEELSYCSSIISPANPESTAPCNEIEYATSSAMLWCISYIQWARIRKVFWTNKEGKWQGRRVRDLANALELGFVTRASGAAGMFVTKHKVLMLS